MVVLTLELSFGVLTGAVEGADGEVQVLEAAPVVVHQKFFEFRVEFDPPLQLFGTNLSWVRLRFSDFN